MTFTKAIESLTLTLPALRPHVAAAHGRWAGTLPGVKSPYWSRPRERQHAIEAARTKRTNRTETSKQL